MNKWIPRIFSKRYDGGEKSGVTAFFLIEWKPIFSIAILKFTPGSREAYHSHAFNGLTWWLKGKVTEKRLNKDDTITSKTFTPSLKPKYTPRDNCHKVIAHTNTYALTFRGPWQDTWYEIIDGKKITLTHGREKVDVA